MLQLNQIPVQYKFNVLPQTAFSCEILQNPKHRQSNTGQHNDIIYRVNLPVQKLVGKAAKLILVLGNHNTQVPKVTFVAMAPAKWSPTRHRERRGFFCFCMQTPEQHLAHHIAWDCFKPQHQNGTAAGHVLNRCSVLVQTKIDSKMIFGCNKKSSNIASTYFISIVSMVLCTHYFPSNFP